MASESYNPAPTVLLDVVRAVGLNEHDVVAATIGYRDGALTLNVEMVLNDAARDVLARTAV